MPRSFTMKAAHMEAFSAQQRKRFEDEMVVYLQKGYPAEFQKMGEPWMRELIREGIEKAIGYDIVLERDVARYIELMMALSPDFDESQKTPWARDILTLRLTAVAKLDRMYEYIMFGPAAPP